MAAHVTVYTAKGMPASLALSLYMAYFSLTLFTVVINTIHRDVDEMR